MDVGNVLRPIRQAGGETVLFGLKLGQPVGQGAMPTAVPVTRTISAMALAASANSRRMGSDEVRRWAVELIGLLYIGACRRRPSPASSCARVARSARGFQQPCGQRRRRYRSGSQTHGWCRHSGPDWERCASPIRVCLLGEPKPGRRQAVKAEAAERGRDSTSLYGLRPVRFTAVSSKRAQTSSLRI